MTEGFESRDAAKKRLRNSVIEGNDRKREGRRSPSLKVYIIGIILLAAALCSVCFLYSRRLSTSYSSVLLFSGEESQSRAGYASFSGGIIKYTKDGAFYLDSDGRTVWDRSYEMSSPIIDVSGDYACIADQGFSRIYIFDTEGLIGVSETLLPVSLVRISEGGVVYAVLYDTDAMYICAFTKDGSALDLSVKSILTGDGFPFDIDVSPDGTELVTSYISVSEGELSNKVVFRNFSSIGQNEDARRIVGGFSEEFENRFCTRVHFADDEYSEAFYDGGVVFFSTRVRNTPTVLSNQLIEENMIGVDSGETLSAVLAENSGDPDEKGSEIPPLRLYVYKNSDGSLKGESTLDISYKSMLVNRDTVVVYSSADILVYTAHARKRAELLFEEGEIEACLSSGKASSLYVVSEGDIYRISF